MSVTTCAWPYEDYSRDSSASTASASGDGASDGGASSGSNSARLRMPGEAHSPPWLAWTTWRRHSGSDKVTSFGLDGTRIKDGATRR